jgi:hypothetical protein
MHDRWGAVDLAAVIVRPIAALREMEEIDGCDDAQCDCGPQAEHEQRVAEVVSVEVDNVPHAADDCVVRKPRGYLAKAIREEPDRHRSSGDGVADEDERDCRQCGAGQPDDRL